MQKVRGGRGLCFSNRQEKRPTFHAGFWKPAFTSLQIQNFPLDTRTPSNTENWSVSFHTNQHIQLQYLRLWTACSAAAIAEPFGQCAFYKGNRHLFCAVFKACAVTTAPHNEQTELCWKFAQEIHFGSTFMKSHSGRLRSRFVNPKTPTA